MVGHKIFGTKKDRTPQNLTSLAKVVDCGVTKPFIFKMSARILKKNKF